MSDRTRDPFNNFIRSLGDVLVDITALEVNTMVVERITGDKFNPWETYRDVYMVDRAYLEQRNVHPSLHNQYLSLRRTLELDYALLCADANSSLFNPAMLHNPAERQVLTNPDLEISAATTHLPDPLHPTDADSLRIIQQLLDSSQFLRNLRKVGELKACLDNRDRSLARMEQAHPGSSSQAIVREVRTDMIYAQTVIQLDGDIINRYSQEILDHPHRELILQIHTESVASGERQWRGLLGFVVNLVQDAIERGSQAVALLRSAR
ncbi:MAG: hypothetical protein HC838_15950 [Spirulinaceae cyanobacterium RM2_2_10]|nr:hypothetical protein [Spirulinaceae cyanobacterium RM2_2_10]